MEGGFLVDEGGGFLPEEGGGFLPEEGGGLSPEEGGGFLPGPDDGGGFLLEQGEGVAEEGSGIVEYGGGGFLPERPETTMRPAPEPEEEDHDFEAEAAMNELEGRGALAENHDFEAEAAMHELERRGAPPGPSQALRPRGPVEGMCEACLQAAAHPRFLETFGVSACFDCQRANKGEGGRYQILTKSKAKDEYLLSDRQLDKSQGGLGCLVQPNPHDSRYGDMKLFLRTQVEKLSNETWGSAEGVFEEKERRRTVRLQKAKRKAAAPGQGPGFGSGDGVGGGRRKAAAGPKSKPKAAPPPIHTHQFEPEEEYDEEEDMWTKRCACGYSLKYERI